MPRRHLVPLLAIAVLSLAAAGCTGGPVSIGGSFPVTGSSAIAANIRACMPAAGRIKVEVDVTSGANPSYLKVGISDDATAFEDLRLFPPPSGFHFEGEGTVQHATGACLVIQMNLNSASPGNPAWDASNRTFNYQISIVT